MPNNPVNPYTKPSIVVPRSDFRHITVMKPITRLKITIKPPINKTGFCRFVPERSGDNKISEATPAAQTPNAKPCTCVKY